MKLDYVVLSVNNDPSYYMLFPMVKPMWEKYGIKCLLVFIGSVLPAELEAFKEDIILFDEIDGVSSVFLAQTVRLLFPATLKTSNAVMISDVDTMAINVKYFVDTIQPFDDLKFINLGHIPEHVPQNEYYMAYNVATPAIWSQVFGVVTMNDIRTKLKEWFVKIGRYHFDKRYRSKCIGFHTDQINLYRHVNDWNKQTGNLVVILKNFERIAKKDDCRTFPNKFQTTDFVDYHMFRPFEKHMAFHKKVIELTRQKEIRMRSASTAQLAPVPVAGPEIVSVAGPEIVPVAGPKEALASGPETMAVPETPPASS